MQAALNSPLGMVNPSEVTKIEIKISNCPMIFLCYDISFKGAYTTRPPTVKKANVDTFILEFIILLLYLLRHTMDNSYMHDNGLVL